MFTKLASIVAQQIYLPLLTSTLQKKFDEFFTKNKRGEGKKEIILLCRIISDEYIAKVAMQQMQQFEVVVAQVTQRT